MPRPPLLRCRSLGPPPTPAPAAPSGGPGTNRASVPRRHERVGELLDPRQPTGQLLGQLVARRQRRGGQVADLGLAAVIPGVPATGLPKITSLVSRSWSPLASASPLWSTTVNSLRPFLATRSDSRVTVSFTERGLSLVTISPAALISPS